MKTYTLLALGLCMIGTACKNDLEPQESSVPLAPANETAAATQVAAPAGQPMAQPVSQNTPQVQAQPQTATAPGMNPPHGQPGHRCDIAVGTPLSQPIQTKPAQPASQPITINANGQVSGANQAMKVTQTPAPAQKVAEGMNPAHGQPGHRCDIAVGAPLNSPPGKPAAASTPMTIGSDGKVTGGNGNVKITRTDNNAPKTEIPTLLQAPPADPAK